MDPLSHKVFIDTSLIVAFIDRTDFNHQKAVELFDFLADKRFRLYTSFTIVVSTFNRLEKDLGTVIGTEFLEAIGQSNILVLYPSSADLQAAFRFYKANPNPQNSLNQVINARLMEKNNLSYILTLDLWHEILGIKLSPLLNY